MTDALASASALCAAAGGLYGSYQTGSAAPAGFALSFVSVFPTIFFSHQWLSFQTPDPDNIHYAAIKEAADAVTTTHELTRDSLFVWIE